MAKIKLEQINFKYHKGPVIFDHFNQEIPLNTLTQISGDNGIGKTTLLKLIGHILEPQRGCISRPPRQKIGLALSEVNGLFPRLTGHENLKIFSNLLKFDLNAISEWKENTAFKKALHTPIKEASEGMKKSIVLFRAFLSGDIILLDEPFLSLDSHFCDWLNHKIIHSQKTIILTSHKKLDFINESICLN